MKKQGKLMKNKSLRSNHDGKGLWQRDSIVRSISCAMLPASEQARSLPSWSGTEPFGLVEPMC